MCHFLELYLVLSLYIHNLNNSDLTYLVRFTDFTPLVKNELNLERPNICISFQNGVELTNEKNHFFPKAMRFMVSPAHYYNSWSSRGSSPHFFL